MAYENLIKTVKNSVLDTIRQQSEDAWLSHKDVDIKQEVETEKKKLEEQYAVKFEADLKKYQQLQQQTTPYSSYYYPNPFVRYPTCQQPDVANIERQVKASYIRDFKTKWDSDLKRPFNAQLDRFDPENIVKQLLKKHPWLDPEDKLKFGAPTNHLVSQFLFNTLYTRLSVQYDPPITDWRKIRGALLEAKASHWHPDTLDEKWLDNQTQGYPLSDVHQFYLRSARPEYPSLLTPVKLNQAPSRVDLLRLLANNYPAAMRAKPNQQIDCTEIAPFHLDELKQLKDQQWERLKFLLINVGTEKEPLWIGLHKTGGQWNGYAPPFLKLTHDQTSKLPQDLIFQEVDYSENLKLNNIEGLSKETQWHAVLLARILPATQSNKGLKNYRDRVPLSSLLQDTIEGSTKLEYSSFSNQNMTVTNAFHQRQPFSNSAFETLYPDQKSFPNLLIHDYSFAETLKTKALLQAFDDKKIEIEEKDLSGLKLNEVNAPEFINALTLAYHNGISRLNYTWKWGFNQSPYQSIIEQLFTYDVNLRFIAPPEEKYINLSDYAHAMQCAARNRFLLAEAPDYVDRAKSDVEKRRLIWRRVTGETIAAFFRKNGQKFDLDFVEKMLAFKKKWREGYCDFRLEDQKEPEMMSFVQIAEMGKQGLDRLFEHLTTAHVANWDNFYRENPPNLRATFDLTGSLADRPDDYIEYFISKIRYVDIFKKCSPLFNPLSIILPQTSTFNVDRLLPLIELLDERSKKNPEENCELVLYNLDFNPTALTLIKALQNLAEHHNLHILIRIPAWDRASPTDRLQRSKKNEYRLLQNKVLDNQRADRNRKLKDSVKAIHESAERKSDTKALVTESQLQQPQPWDEKYNVSYPLTKVAVGIQQQLQQQNEQQQELEQEEEKEQQETPPPIINQYFRDESDLITRHTINSHQPSKLAWKKTPKAIKKLSGIQDSDLSQLFSIWVGSQKDAAHVIAKMQPAAIEELMRYAPEHRMGLSKDNLPAGFRLAYSNTNNDLILCFSEKDRKDDLRNRAQMSEKARNPFTVTTHTAKPATVFKGDFRQFDVLAVQNPDDQQTLWRYLATEDNDVKRIENAKLTFKTLTSVPEEKDLKTVADDEASVIMQRYDVFEEIKNPQDHQACLKILKNWAAKSNASDDLQKTLFEEKKTALTPKNLKAFGQLFNHFDALDKKEYGTNSWLFIADQIYKTFGPKAFAIWKKRFLDPSKNWAECLDKEEVDAIALSIDTLKTNPAFQEIWWKLVNAHGRTTGHMRYSHLWQAYLKLMTYLTEHRLKINTDTLFKYLRKVKNFNGNVFLDRLHSVLNKVATQLDYQAVQQKILNRIDEIDWHHDGFYYAACYESHPFWDDALNLKGLALTRESKENSYIAHWNASEKLTDARTHALRFASRNMRLSLAEFETFKQRIAEEKLAKKNPLVLRLFTASLAIGMDHLDSLEPKSFQTVCDQMDTKQFKFLEWLNENISLEGELLHHTFHLHFKDVSVVYEAINALKLFPYLKKLEPEAAFQFINACGRVLQCFKDDQQRLTKLQSILRLAIQEKRPSILSDYPWIISEYSSEKDFKDKPDPFNSAVAKTTNGLIIAELHTFQEQLRSIDFSKKSPFLPSYAMLYDAFMKIAEADPTEAPLIRKQFISSWLEKGCPLRYQDAKFNKVSETEAKAALVMLTTRFKASYSSQNLNLFRKFIEDHLAFDTGVDEKSQVTELVNLLLKFDNKNYYNEVGQLLGLLISQAKSTNKNYYYSIPQLVQWLSALHNESTYAKQHYPIDLLREVLTNCLHRDDSGLLSNELSKLTRSHHSLPLLKHIEAISRSRLPNQYKPIIVKLSMERPDQFEYILVAQDSLRKMCETKGVDAPWLKAFSEAIPYWANHNSELQKKGLSQLSQVAEFKEPDLINLWQATQIKLINLLVKRKITADKMDLFTESSSSIRIILAQATDDTKDIDTTAINQLKIKLNQLGPLELTKLAKYFYSSPSLSVTTLYGILQEGHKTADKIIHQFETVEQNKDPNNPHGKRNYSVDAKDQKDLHRIMRGMKRKGQGPIEKPKQNHLLGLLFYLNNYAKVAKLHELEMKDLKSNLQQARKDLKAMWSDEDKHYASARLLACMREILLRKIGKWANHTQMLDLLYAALNNNDSLLHQVRPGQGKSIISIMRAAYLAFDGYIVDIFSSKEVLSKRDHDEFVAVLDEMGIPRSHLTANSEAKEYQDSVNADNIGAVNFATVGNFSLFHSRHIWKATGKLKILNKTKRVAFLDECDHLLQDEQTQFNFPDNGGNDAIYNLDEWVYRATDDFYNQLAAKAEKKGGLTQISTDPDLKALCTYLIEQSKLSPKQSHFFQKYLIPALSNDEEAIKKRNQQLKLLLMAAHSASQLNENLDYSIWTEEKTVQGGLVVPIRFAKVMINNQVQHGSTFSELVQQFLHVRLNKEAAIKGETPNFFVDPESEIVLSQNSKYILKTYYGKLEGCSGTAGNSQDLSVYENEYGIKHVIKLPTHEETRTVIKPAIYCENEDEQVIALAKAIIENNDQPILVTCRDDIEVKRLAEKVRAKISELATNFNFDKYITDTNDSGKKESDIVPLAGKIGAITFSSRMGRGTDIKPEGKKGLLVLRTYPSIPRIVKQENGRQGRNGAEGSCQDIINYGEVLDFSRNTPHKDRLTIIYKEEEEHLKLKLEKHKKLGSTKWNYLCGEEKKNKDDREKYLMTRSVELLKFELKKQKTEHLRLKEFLIATLSGEVMRVLQEIGSFDESANLRNDWLLCRKEIEAAWNGRLANKKEDDNKVYEEFYEKAKSSWSAFATVHNLNRHIFSGLPSGTSPKPPEKKKNVNQEEKKEKDTNQAATITLYQQWLIESDKHYFKNPTIRQELITTIYGRNYEGLKVLHQALEEANNHAEHSELLTSFTDLLKNKSSAYSVTCESFGKTVRKIRENQSIDSQNHFVFLNHFFDQKPPFNVFPRSCSTTEIEKNSLLMELIVNIFTAGFILDGNATKILITNLCQVIYANFWDKLDQNMVTELSSIFASHADTAKLLTATNQKDLLHFIELIMQPAAPESRYKRKTQLNEYLRNHARSMRESKGQAAFTRPLFELTLRDMPSHDLQTNYLPPPNTFEKWDFETQKKLWHFLARRGPIDEKSYQEFLKWLPEGPREGLDDDHALLKPLCELPPIISLKYLKQNLRSYFGLHYSNDGESKISDIHQAGLAFNHFLSKRDIIDQNHHPVPAETKQFLKWNDIFDKMSPQKNKVFFEVASKFVSLPEEALQALALAFSLDGIKNADLEVFFNFATSLYRLNDSTTREFIKEKWQSLLHEPTNKNKKQMLEDLNELDQFIKIFTDHPKLLGQELKSLWQEWARYRNLSNLKTSLTIIQALKEKEGASEIHSKLSSSFIQCREDPSPRNERYLSFIKLLAKAKNSGLSPKALSCLHNVFDKQVIKKNDHWENFLKVIREADTLKEKKEFDAYFTAFDCTNRKNRLELMQHLECGLLDLGGIFKETCYEQYYGLFENIIKPPEELNKMNYKGRADHWRDCHLQLIHFSHELNDIAKNPYGVEKIQSPHPYTHSWGGSLFLGGWDAKSQPREKYVDDTFKTRYREYFNEQKNSYSGFWYWITTNSARQSQKTILFTALAESTKENKLFFSQDILRKDFYLDGLEMIIKTQQTILKTDKATTSNSKGHSRLFDITNRMFVKLALDFISDQNVSFEDKSNLHTMLQMQLKFTVELLADRLDFEAFQPTSLFRRPLKNPVVRWKSDLQKLVTKENRKDNPWHEHSTELVKLGKLMATVPRDDVPKHLHYLLDHLTGFVEISSQCKRSAVSTNLQF